MDFKVTKVDKNDINLLYKIRKNRRFVVLRSDGSGLLHNSNGKEEKIEIGQDKIRKARQDIIRLANNHVLIDRNIMGPGTELLSVVFGDFSYGITLSYVWNNKLGTPIPTKAKKIIDVCENLLCL